MNAKLPDILPPVAPLMGELGYKFQMDVPPEFVAQLSGPANKGRLSNVEYAETEAPAIYTISISWAYLMPPALPSSFTSNTDL